MEMWSIVTGILLLLSELQLVEYRFRSFLIVVLASINMKSSCSAASLMWSTTSATTSGPHHDLVWNHFKTTCGKAYNGIHAERAPFQFFEGHVDLSIPQMPRISRTS